MRSSVRRQDFTSRSFQIVPAGRGMLRADLEVVPSQREHSTSFAVGVVRRLTFPEASTRAAWRILQQPRVAHAADQAERTGTILRQLVFDAPSGWVGHCRFVHVAESDGVRPQLVVKNRIGRVGDFRFCACGEQLSTRSPHIRHPRQSRTSVRHQPNENAEASCSGDFLRGGLKCAANSGLHTDRRN